MGVQSREVLAFLLPTHLLWRRLLPGLPSLPSRPFLALTSFKFPFCIRPPTLSRACPPCQVPGRGLGFRDERDIPALKGLTGECATETWKLMILIRCGEWMIRDPCDRHHGCTEYGAGRVQEARGGPPGGGDAEALRRGSASKGHSWQRALTGHREDAGRRGGVLLLERRGEGRRGWNRRLSPVRSWVKTSEGFSAGGRW